MSPKTFSSAWSIFAVLVLANTAISFLPVPLEFKIVIGVLFLLLPLWFLAKGANLPENQTQSILKVDFLSAPSVFIWLSVMGLAVVFRFWDITSLSVWPTSDEGYVNYLALHLFEKWNWNLLFAHVQQPPAHIWGLSFFFHFFTPSLFSEWLFTAILSTITLGLIYGAARMFFTSGFSFLCLLLAVLNYWLIWSGRISYNTLDFVVPLECIALICMGFALKTADRGYRSFWPFVWGLATGLCLYAATESIFMVGMMGFTVLAVGLKNQAGRVQLWKRFGLGFLVVVPLVIYALFHHYGTYVNSLWLTSGSGYDGNRWMAPLSHITALFWGAKDWTFWGGLFNPMESALVFVGLVFAFRNRQSPLFQWMLAAFAFFILPGLLTNSFEPFREVLLLPLLIAFAALGWSWLVSEMPLRWSRIGTVVLVLLCAGLNLFHVWGPYRLAWGVQGPSSSRFKSIESWRAYDILNSVQEKEGPGVIFQNFAVNPDQSLAVPIYPFNVNENPKLAGARVHWFAFLYNAQWTNYLKQRFPYGHWYWLSEHLPTPNGGLMLAVIALTPENVEAVQKWRQADAVLRDMIYDIVDCQSADPGVEALTCLQSGANSFNDDPFLQAVYWDKVQGLQAGAGNVPMAVEALKNGIHRGFPNAYFYVSLGSFLKQEGKDAEADRAFAEAKTLMVNSPSR